MQGYVTFSMPKSRNLYQFFSITSAVRYPLISYQSYCQNAVPVAAATTVGVAAAASAA